MPYLLLATFLWGTSFVAGKYAIAMADAAWVVLFRLLIAACCTLPASIRFLRHHRLSRAQCKALLLLALLTYPVTFLLQFIGLQHTSAASATTMIGLAPLMVILVGHYCFHKTASARIWLLGAVAFLGVFLLVGGSPRGEVSVFGCGLVFASTIVAAFWVHLSVPMLMEIGSRAYTALTLQLGTLLTLAPALWLAHGTPIRWSASGIAAIVYLGLGCSLLAAWAWNRGLQDVPAERSGIFLALEPTFGVLLAVVCLSERLAPSAALGVALVLGAAALAMMPRGRV